MNKKEHKRLDEAYKSIYEQQLSDFAAGGGNAKMMQTGMSRAAVEALGKKNLAAKPGIQQTSTFSVDKSGLKGPDSLLPTSTPATPATSTAPQKTFQQELDDLRKASAQATMAGPSKEAQALMSTRTKNILGPEKLRAGIEAQQKVEKMKSEIGMPKVEAPKPQAPTPPTTSTQQPQAPKPPVPDRSKDYQMAWDNRNNPFAKGRIQAAWSKMSPEEKAAAKDWAKKNNKNWQEMGLPESTDIYDRVLDYLINEGCTLEESNYIMSYIVEQSMPPQEIITRGIAQFLFGPQNKTSAKVKPNPYRPGATIRATGPNLDKFPELQRFADQGRKIAEPVAKTAGALAALRNITPAGVAAAVMAPRPTGDATLTAAMKRGDVAPPAPKPKLVAPEKEKVSVQPPVKSAVSTAKPKVAKPAAPEDPNLKKYAELRKTDPAAAKELGMKIWTQKYRPAFSRPDIV